MLKFTQKDIGDILKLYNSGKSSYYICNIYNVSRPTITKIIKQNGVIRKRTPRYSTQRDYFKTIDTEQKAYLLGLLYADGFVSLEKSICSLALKSDDIKHLRVINELINNNAGIKCKQHSKFKCCFECTISLFGKDLCQDLIDKGCLEKKSLILKFPTTNQVPTELIRHFIRGYFDGDGSNSVDKRSNSMMFSFCGTYDMMENIHKILVKECQLNDNKIFIRKDGLVIIRWAGNKLSKRFFDYIYKDATVYLERKYNKFQSILS